MNKKTLEILACPVDKHSPLELFELLSKDEIVIDGVLFCSVCSRFYPIIEEIPIMLPGEETNKNQYTEFFKKYKDKLPEKMVRKDSPWNVE